MSNKKMHDQVDMIEILRLLPQKYPWVLIDQIMDFNEEEKKIVVMKNFTYNEEFFPVHFPSDPVCPGVLMIEIMAQSTILLSLLLKGYVNKDGTTRKCDDNFYMTRLGEMTFKNFIRPGDYILIETKMLKSRHPMIKFHSSIVSGNIKTNEKKAITEVEICGVMQSSLIAAGVLKKRYAVKNED